jgi:hypothetical protein
MYENKRIVSLFVSIFKIIRYTNEQADKIKYKKQFSSYFKTS